MAYSPQSSLGAITQEEYQNFGLTESDLKAIVEASNGPVVFLDYETTGLNAKEHAITEISALKVLKNPKGANPPYVIQKFTTHLLPIHPKGQGGYGYNGTEYKIDEGALEVTGTRFIRDGVGGRITGMEVLSGGEKNKQWKKLQNVPTWAEVARPFLDFLKDAETITAYNAPFDMAFSKAKFEDVGLAGELPLSMTNPPDYVCQRYSYLAYQGEGPSNTQDDAFKLVENNPKRKINFAGRQEHAAYEDTLMLMAIYAELLGTLGRPMSIQDLFGHLFANAQGDKDFFRVQSSNDPDHPGGANEFEISYPLDRQSELTPRARALWQAMEEFHFVKARGSNRASQHVGAIGLRRESDGAFHVRSVVTGNENGRIYSFLLKMKMIDQLLESGLVENVRAYDQTTKFDVALKGGAVVKDVPLGSLRKSWSEIKKQAKDASSLSSHLELLKGLELQGKAGLVVLDHDDKNHLRVTIKAHQRSFGSLSLTLPDGNAPRHYATIVQMLERMHKIGAMPDIETAAASVEEGVDEEKQSPWVYLGIDLGSSKPVQLDIREELMEPFLNHLKGFMDPPDLNSKHDAANKMFHIEAPLEDLEKIGFSLRQISWLKYRLEELPGVREFEWRGRAAVLHMPEGLDSEMFLILQQTGMPFTASFDRVVVDFSALASESYHWSQMIQDGMSAVAKAKQKLNKENQKASRGEEDAAPQQPASSTETDQLYQRILKDRELHITFDGMGGKVVSKSTHPDGLQLSHIPGLHYMPFGWEQKKTCYVLKPERFHRDIPGYEKLFPALTPASQINQLHKQIHDLILQLPSEADLANYRSLDMDALAKKLIEAEKLFEKITISGLAPMQAFFREGKLTADGDTVEIGQIMQALEQDRKVALGLYHGLDQTKSDEKRKALALETATVLGGVSHSITRLERDIERVEKSYLGNRGNSLVKSLGEWHLVNGRGSEGVQMIGRTVQSADKKTSMDGKRTTSSTIVKHETEAQAWHELALALAAWRKDQKKPLCVQELQRLAGEAFENVRGQRAEHSDDPISQMMHLFAAAEGVAVSSKVRDWESKKEKLIPGMVELLQYALYRGSDGKFRNDLLQDKRMAAGKQLAASALAWRDSLELLRNSLQFTRFQLENGTKFFEERVPMPKLERATGRVLQRQMPRGEWNAESYQFTIPATKLPKARKTSAPAAYIAQGMDPKWHATPDWIKAMLSSAQGIGKSVQRRVETTKDSIETRWQSWIAADTPLPKLEDLSDVQLANLRSDELLARWEEHDVPLKAKSLDALADKIADFVANYKGKDPLGIISDYDVDGATSAALMHRYLGMLGVKVEVRIPDRFREGYGPAHRLVDELKTAGAKKILTLDCGSLDPEKPLPNSSKSAPVLQRAATELGMEVMVVDHHNAKPVNATKNVALVNANFKDDENNSDLAPLKKLSAVGMSFMLALATTEKLRERGYFKNHKEPAVATLLDLVAVGHLSDVMPLQGFGNELFKAGLSVLGRRMNIGFNALMNRLGITEAPTISDIAFGIGPTINSCGRLTSQHGGDSSMGYRLLSLTNEGNNQKLAEDLAEKMNFSNERRKTLQKEVMDAAIPQAEAQVAAGAPVIVAYGKDWNEGVIGIVAGQLKERYDRPAIVFGASSDTHGVVKGSARSVPGYSIGAAVETAKEKGILIGGGGHEMAAGMGLKASNVETFRRFIQADAQAYDLPALVANIRWPASRILALGQLNDTLIQETIEKQNMDPEKTGILWALEGIEVKKLSKFGLNRNHLKVDLWDGKKTITANAFHIVGSPMEKLLEDALEKRTKVQLLIEPNLHRNSPQVNIKKVDNRPLATLLENEPALRAVGDWKARVVNQVNRGKGQIAA